MMSEPQFSYPQFPSGDGYDHHPAVEPPVRRAPFWRIAGVSLGFMLLHLLVLTAAGAVIGGIYVAQLTAQNPGKTWSQTELARMLLTSNIQSYASIAMALLVIPIYWLFIRSRKKVYLQSLPDRPLKLGRLPGAATLIVGALGLVNLLMLLMKQISQSSERLREMLGEYSELAESMANIGKSRLDWIIPLISLVILVPIAEELLFRGIVMGELMLRFPPKVTVLIQMLLFGLFHLNPIQSSYVMIPGLFLGIAYYLSRNLWVPIIMHMIFNFLGGMLPLMLNETQLTWLMIAQLVLAVYALIVCVRFFAQKQKSSHEVT